MKLTTKTALLNLLFILPVLTLGGWMAWYLITKEIRQNTDERLLSRKQRIENRLSSGDSTLFKQSDSDSLLIITETTSGQNNSLSFYDTLIYDRFEREEVPFRKLVWTETLGSKNYSFTLLQAGLEEDDLTEGVITSLLVVFFSLLVLIPLLTFLISGKLWKPFYESLEKIKGYRLGDPAPEFRNSNTTEFKRLNLVLSEWSAKMRTDYQNLREFTENASHEIQTPLAVIQSQLDLLAQSEKLGETEYDLLAKIQDSISRMSVLNKNLLLLAKIENAIPDKNHSTPLLPLIEKQKEHFSDKISALALSFQVSEDSFPNLPIEDWLAEVLVSNLVKNAIWHNKKGGRIIIKPLTSGFAIENSGEENPLPARSLFSRFKKWGNKKEGNGLGLALIKSVTEISGGKVNYYFSESFHRFEVTFPSRIATE